MGGKILTIAVIITAAMLISTHIHAQSDNDPPDIIAVYPQDGASVPDDTRLSITFSEPMDPGSIATKTITLKATMGRPVSGAVTYANRTASFVPFGHLDDNEQYTATVSGIVRDISGNLLGSDYSWSFSTTP